VLPGVVGAHGVVRQATRDGRDEAVRCSCRPRCHPPAARAFRRSKAHSTARSDEDARCVLMNSMMSDYKVKLVDENPADMFVIFHGPKDSAYARSPCSDPVPTGWVPAYDFLSPAPALPRPVRALHRQAYTRVARGRSTCSSPKGIRTSHPPSVSATACSTRTSTRCEPHLAVLLARQRASATTHRVPSPLLLPACTGRDRCAWTSSIRPGPRCSVRARALCPPSERTLPAAPGFRTHHSPPQLLRIWGIWQ
jgi:hypothetical protein